MSDSTFISSRAVVHEGVLLGRDVRILGRCVIGPYAVIDDGVTIGYPTVEEQKALRDYKHRGSSCLDAFLDGLAQHRTVVEEGAVIRSHSVVYGGTSIGPGFDCGHGSVVRDRATIGSGVYVYPLTTIGVECEIGDGCRVAGTLCNRTRLGSCVTFLGHSVHEYALSVPGAIERSPVMCDFATVGREAVVVGGVVLGEYSLLCANSVTTKDLPERALAAGTPARVIRIRSDQDISGAVSRQDEQ